jgi:hypothetical protein
VLVVTFAKVGTLVLMVENSIVTTQTILWNINTISYFRETSISCFGDCGYNHLNKYNEGNVVFADAHSIHGINYTFI